MTEIGILMVEVQCRSEETGLSYHSTLAAALKEAFQNPTIWKISFSLPNGERVRLVNDGTGTFVLEQLADGVKVWEEGFTEAS